MRKLAVLFIASLYSFAISFTSVHQLNAPQGLINKFKQYLDYNGKPTVKEFYDGTSFVVTSEAQAKGDSWCGAVMPSYKIYIPAGLENVTIGAVAKPNSSYYIWYAFVPDGQNYTDRTLPFRFVKMIDAKVIYQKWNTKQSGWLYLRIIQASNFVYSQFGHIDGPRVYLSVKYLFKDDMTDFNNWLKTTYFASNGDPVDMFSKAYETSRYCSSYGEKIAVYGSTSGVLGSSLVPWLQTDDPSLTIESDKTSIPQTSSNINYTINYRVGEKPISSISIDINNNITDGVLLQDHIDTCMKFVEASKESGKDGVFVYSDNGENWYLNRYDTAIANNIHYIGYLIKDGNPNNGDSEQVLLAHESGSIKITADIVQNCLSKSSLVNVATIKYERDGTEKSVQNTLTITANASSGGTVSGGSGGSGGGGSASGSGGNTGSTAGDDASYYGGGTTQQPSNNTSSTESESDAKRECESNGGRWIDSDKQCLINPSTTHSSNSSGASSMSSSYSSSVSSYRNGEKSQAQKECENNGGRWIDSDKVCLSKQYSSSLQSSSSSSNKGDEFLKIERVVKRLAKKEFPVEGYFVHYGEEAFDWIYRTREGGLYKLEGMDKNGYFQWTSLKDYFLHTEVLDGKLILGDEKITRDLDTRILSVIRAIRSKESYPINGYFINYGNGAFDWAYVVGDRIYKLDGMDENGYFKWIPLTNYFNRVEIKNYTKIKIGETRIEKEHQKKKKDYETIPSNSSISSLSNSFSNSLSSSSSSFSRSSSSQNLSNSSTHSLLSSSSAANNSIDNIEDFPSN